MAPLVITNSGLSTTMMGIIIGTSSITGAIFDFIVCRIFKNSHYKKVFFIMFALCLIYPLILFKANSFILYLIAMSIWGIYFDLKNIGNFDYVGRFTKKHEHSESFGLVQVFLSMGFLIAPILVGAIIAERLDWKPFIAAWIFLAIAFFFFLLLILFTRKKAEIPFEERHESRRSTWTEIGLWGEIGKILFPVLLLTLFLNFIDSFFWTVGPLFAESLEGMHKLAGFFMTAYSLPALLVGWFVGSLTKSFGKKRTASLTLFIGSLIMSLMYFTHTPIMILTLIFFSSIFISMSWPAINGAYADYISETAKYESEIAGLEDFYTNIGYVIGPISAGFLADKLGNSAAFSILGVLGVFVSLYLLSKAKKHININRELIN